MTRRQASPIRLLAALCLALCQGTARAAPVAPGDDGTDAPVGDAWSDPRNPIRRLWEGRRLDLWSLRPPAASAPPPGPESNPVDRFLPVPHRGGGEGGSRQADRRTLLRRATFGLTGLPPSLEEVRAFEADTRPGAWARQVDRLLASPAYGEHQARLWLDVVRYSDSNGFDWDEFRREAWRFRDYVVRSFNADKPFDRFIREQIAGDELLAAPPATPAEQDALIATGYLRLGPHDNAAPLFNEQDRSRDEWMADLVETTGSAFLGLTLACCRCHDHKYDPLSQADHFRLRAFFAGVKFADDLPLDLAGRQEEIRRHNAGIDAALARPPDRRLDARRTHPLGTPLRRTGHRGGCGASKAAQRKAHTLGRRPPRGADRTGAGALEGLGGRGGQARGGPPVLCPRPGRHR